MEEIKLSDINLLDVGHSIQIAGVIWTGNGLAFATQFPGKNEDLSNLKKMIMPLEDWQTFLRQTDILEAEIIGTDPDTGKLIKAIVRKTSRQIDSYVQWAVFRRDNYTCRYCGRNDVPLTVDHIDLWEKGGKSTLENMVAACKNCNKDRGNMEYEVWLQSKQYTQRSAKLSPEAKQANLDLLAELPKLRNDRADHIRKR